MGFLETVKALFTWERVAIIVLGVLLLISLFYPRYQFIATGNGYVFRGDRATGKVFVFRAQHLYADQRRLEAAREAEPTSEWGVVTETPVR